MTNAVVTTNGARPVFPTVLGRGPVRIPTGGKIRAGIKVLTKKAAENAQAKKIYENGVNANRSFDDIEREITEAVPELKTPLVPKNVPWFTVRPDDFPNHEIARQVLEMYGEDRGDGQKRLYRFPVVFPADMWQTVMPHQLIAWGASEKKYWSEYAPDGRVRYCKCYAPVLMDGSGKRAVRMFGGRKTTLRQENDGLCDPETCREYQNRQCNLSGQFIFFIPGIKSIDAFELHTNSFYAMNAAIQKFETIAFMRGGRISGFLDNKQTSFFITKKLVEVPHIDDQGRAVRVKHWIIELEAPIDVTALLRPNDEDETALINAAAAARLLEGPRVLEREVERDSDAPKEATSSSSSVAAESDVASENTAPRATLTDSQTRSQQVSQAPLTSGGNRPAYDQVIAAAEALGIESERYVQYAAKRWGPGWKMNALGLRRAAEELEKYQSDADGMITKVNSELNIFS